ncbi:RING finger and SPRY domain-containing protein 1 [Papilio machaon]|uniref:RING finger and SPRY domain-containing protein 1 n=1 Tax=Papilio machaon TaxID=76193 RepID=A0A194QN17_PAPMA|nr:RING finger and SPRY domain-containing protein 1 [Papilio machaon]
MEGAVGHLNDHDYIHMSRPSGIWAPQSITHIVLQILQKLRPRNTVTFQFNLMLKFIAHISQNETNWLAVVSSMMENMPIDSYTITAIVIIMRAIPSPNVTTVNMLLHERHHLSAHRAVAPYLCIRRENNICVVLNCLVEKLINSRNHNDLELQMRALLALEKFAVTKENKAKILEKLAQVNKNHLTNLEMFLADTANEYSVRREIGYCARWALDNIFPKPGRQLSYDTVDITTINGMLKNDSGNIYLKYSPDLMEIRNDTILSQTLHGTCEVEEGAWFYEITLVTKDSMTIGWGCTGADTENKVGYEEFSIGYEGKNMLLWYYRAPHEMGLGRWRKGDVLGCLLDINNKMINFFLNGRHSMIIYPDFFSPTRPPKKFFPAITMPPFQQCIVNLGQKPFRSAPEGVHFSALSSVGQLTPQLRMIYGMPRSAMQERQASFNASEDACDICCDRAVDVTLHPCGHRTLCHECSMKLKTCPVCRAPIAQRR